MTTTSPSRNCSSVSTGWITETVEFGKALNNLADHHAKARDIQHYINKLFGIDIQLNEIRQHVAILRVGNVPPGLLPTRLVYEKLRRLQKDLLSEDFHVLIQDLSGFFQLPTTMTRVDSSLRIIVHVPITYKNTILHLYEYLPTPIRIGKTYIQIQPDKAFMGINQDRTLYHT